MSKDDLRKNGFSEVTKYPRQSGINILWVLLALFFIIGTSSGLFFIFGVILGGIGETPADVFIYFIESFGILGYMIFLIISLLVYLLLKLFITILFSNKSGSVRMKIYYGMPICFCSEALKVWQIILINMIPFILMYSLYAFLSIYYQSKFMFILMFYFMLFFLTFDLAAVIYVIFFKVKDRMDYISLDRHVYEVTLFKRRSVKFSKKSKSKKSGYK